MEKANEINKATAVETQANSVQGINHAGVDQQAPGVTYMECRRNYLAPIGGYLEDVCQNFVKRSDGQDQNNEALSFLCARCGCHRSFHRKVLLSPPHLRDSTGFHHIMDYLYSLPPPTPWLMQSLQLANCELVEGQGSSLSPEEGDQGNSESDSGDEVNQS